MEQAGFWSRVGQLFRSSRRGGPVGGALGGLSSDGLLDDERSHNSGDVGRIGLTFSKRRQREQALEKLQEAYQQVAGLIQSILAHLQAQDRRSEQMADALTRMAETTDRISEAASAQSERLGAIAAQLETGNDRARRWEQVLSDLPKLAEGQREALSAIHQELQSSQEADRQMVETLGGFREAVTSWGESSTASTQALTELKEAASRRDEELNTLIATQSKRFTWLFVVTLVLAAAAIATGIIALLKQP